MDFTSPWKYWLSSKHTKFCDRGLLKDVRRQAFVWSSDVPFLSCCGPETIENQKNDQRKNIIIITFHEHTNPWSFIRSDSEERFVSRTKYLFSSSVFCNGVCDIVYFSWVFCDIAWNGARGAHHERWIMNAHAPLDGKKWCSWSTDC